MVNLKTLEAEIKEAKKKKESEVVEAQIEVYEGQNYEARESYEKTQQERITARSKLPKDTSTDKEYAKQDLEAQYIQMRVASPVQEKQVKEYRAEIKRQREVSKSVQVLDKELPQLYASAVQEVESTKTKARQAKEKVETKYDAVIQTKQETFEKETTRRESQWEKIETDYQKRLSENPYTPEHKKETWELANQFGRASKVRFEYEWSKDISQYNKNALHTKLQAEKKLREQHYTADGFQFASGGTGQRDFGKAVADYQMGRPLGYRNISARGQHQFNLWLAKEDLLYGRISESEYSSKTGSSQLSYKSYQTQAEKQRIKQAQAKAHGQLAADAKHWANVASNPYTSNPNATTPNFTVGSGTKDDPFRTDYNKGKTAIGETTTPPKDMLAYYIQDYQKQSKTYNKAKTGLENTNYSQADLQQINKQRENELANTRQTQYVTELRAGNIGYADALMNPQTTQSYTGTSTVNLKTFLKERGYDLTKPEAIPNSVLTTPVKYDKAREVASESAKLDTTMGDLRTKEPYYAGFSVSDGKMAWNYKYPLASKEVIQQRMEAKQRIAKFDPLTPAVQRKEGTKTGVKFTNLPAPQVGTLDSGGVLTKKDFNPYSASAPTEVAMMKATGQQYVVGSRGFSPFPMMAGGTFDARTPVTTDTLAEAQYKAKTQQTRVFSGFDNSALEGWNYASAVETGEVINPSKTETWVDDARLKLSQMFRPTYNIGAMAYNLSQPQDKQLPIKSTAEDVLIGGTIEDVKEGNILKGTGITGLGKYIEEDYFRAGFELPSAVFTAMAGGKAISYGVKGVSYGVNITAKLGNKIIQGNAPTIVKVPTMAVMRSGQAIQRTGAKVSAIPSRIGSSIYDYGNIPRGYGQGGYKAFRSEIGDKKFTPTQQMVRQGIVRPYDKFTMFQGSRVGFGTKMNFIMTPSGRMFVRQTTDIGSDIGARPQFLNRQVAMFETDSVTGFATRGKMKTVEKTLPKAKTFESEVFSPTKKTELVLKNPPKEKKPFPELYDSKATTSGKPFPELVKVENIPTRAPTITKPDIDIDRARLTRIGQRGKDVEVKKVKTAVDEITFYSDTTGDLIKGVKRPSKAEIQGELDNYKAFEKPTITGTREEIQTFKTSTSRISVKGELKYSKLAGDKIKLKGSPIREIDTIATGAKVSGERNIEIVEDLVEKGRIKEVGKKTVIQGSDYFAGGKSTGQLKPTLESRSPTQYQNIKGEWKPRDESILYESRDSTRLDTVAFKQTRKESNVFRDESEIFAPTKQTKKINIPDGVQSPTSKTKFTGESTKSGQTLASTTVKETSKKFRKQVAKPDVKTSPYSSAIVGTATKASAVVGTKALASTRVDTGVKIQQEIKTGLVQETALKTQQQLKTPQQLKTGMKLDTGLKLDTGSKLMTQQKSLSMYASPVIMIPKLQRPKPAFIPPIPELAQRDRKGKRKKGKKAGFIGNVRLDNIMGMYKRKEITYGQKKVTKLERQDMRLTAGTKNRIALPSSGLLKTKKKKKSKTESMFGKKSKDEFSGFESKPKKKTTKRKKSKVRLL